MLTAVRICELLEQPLGETPDPLVITPKPDLESLRGSGAASIDLRLGTWFVTLRPARMTHLAIGRNESQAQLTKTQYVPFGTEYILHPRHFVLGITLEWVRLPKDCAAYVIGKSSWGRRGLIIATATGVHPGFAGCLTLELTNVGEIPISVTPGTTICQLCLHPVSPRAAEGVDQSQFVGRRKPTLGHVDLDSTADRLAKAYR